MDRDPIEREVKLAADPEFTLPDLRDLVKRTVRLPEQVLLATYFDTPDHRLWARGITLRHRIGESVQGGIWTLKLPRTTTGVALERTELEWAGSVELMPDRIDELLVGIVRRAVLRRITSLETSRRRLILQGRKQSLLAEVDDDLVTIHGGPHDGRSFRQIEVELDQADDALLQRCVDRFRDAGATIDDLGPKLARALDEQAVGVAALPALGRKSTVAEVVSVAIRSGLDRILDHEFQLRLEVGDPSVHAVHQVRVAARRLRSDLKTFRFLLDPLWVRHTRGDLQWLGEALGRVRDADVLGEHLGLNGRARMGDSTGVTRLRSELQQQRSLSARQLGEVLTSDRYLLLLDKLHAAGERPPFLAGTGHGPHPAGRKAAKVLARTVKGPWRKLRKEVRRAGREPTDRQLHSIRIKAKQLRYAAEAAQPVVGREAGRTARAAEELQTVLGEHHDAVVAEAWLHGRARGAPWKVAYSAGRMAAEQSRRQVELRGEWRSAWRSLRARARRWPG